MIYMYIYMGLQGNSMHINSDWYVTKVHVRIKGLSCSSKQTDIAPKFCAHVLCSAYLISHYHVFCL
jgi:hypothetical protein